MYGKSLFGSGGLHLLFTLCVFARGLYRSRFFLFGFFNQIKKIGNDKARPEVFTRGAPKIKHSFALTIATFNLKQYIWEIIPIIHLIQ
ncbi:hypothetical protein ABIB40_002819 [Pedobacter sp. UYP30]